MSDRSVLVQYDVRDFHFDNIQDSFDRHDLGTVIPRSRTEETATERFTRAASMASRVTDKPRFDLTDRPQSFRQATTRVPERQTQVGKTSQRSRKETAKALSVTIKHFEPHPGKPTKPGRNL